RDPAWKQSYRFVRETDAEEKSLRWIVVEELRAAARSEESRAVSHRLQTLRDHRRVAANVALRLAGRLDLPAGYTDMLTLAARLHDEGKSAWRWQRAFNAPRGTDHAEKASASTIYAKTTGPVNF